MGQRIFFIFLLQHVLQTYQNLKIFFLKCCRGACVHINWMHHNLLLQWNIVLQIRNHKIWFIKFSKNFNWISCLKWTEKERDQQMELISSKERKDHESLGFPPKQVLCVCWNKVSMIILIIYWHGWDKVGDVCCRGIKHLQCQTSLPSMLIRSVQSRKITHNCDGWKKLLELQQQINLFKGHALAVFGAYKAANMGASQWHALTHVIDTLQNIGSVENPDTNVYWSAHKILKDKIKCMKFAQLI